MTIQPGATGRRASTGLPIKILVATIVLLAVGAGLFARGHRLGIRPLCVDEYYFAKSIEFILDTGIPAFPDGGYYVRSVPAQYLAAASAWIFGADGFGFRLPAVLWSLASTGLIFIYGRRYVGTAMAAALGAVLLVSSWQIEFARFARMYSAFQAMTLLFLISVDRVSGGSRWRFVPHILVILTALTHELGILLCPFLFLPLLDERFSERWTSRRDRYLFIFAGASTMVLCELLQQIGFRNWGVQDRFADGIVYPAGNLLSLFRAPTFPFWSITGSPQANLIFLCGLMVVVAAVLVLFKARLKGLRTTDIYLILLLVSVLAHAFLVAAGFLCLLLLRYDIHDYRSQPRRTFVLLAVSVVIGLAWWGWAFWVWEGRGVGGVTAFLKSVYPAFLGWPDVYRPVIRPWKNQFPLLGSLLLLSIAYLVVTGSKQSVRALTRNPCFVLLYVVGCLSVLYSTYVSIRYSFFVYPIALCTMALAARGALRCPPAHEPGRVVRWREGGAVLLFVLAFAASRDFAPAHIRNVSGEEVSFRLHRWERYAEAWYPRWDFLTPAEFVNAVPGRETESVVIVEGQPPVSYYLHGPHAQFYSRDDSRFRGISRNRSRTELWSGQRLLSTRSDLLDYSANVSTVWLVRGTDQGRAAFEVAEVWGRRLRNATRAYLSVDGRIEVLQVLLHPPSRGSSPRTSSDEDS